MPTTDKDMMEVGSHCEAVNCHQLDFLPIECRLCQKTFCRDHSPGDRHDCPHSQDNVLTVKPEKTKNVYGCSIHDCDKKELVPITCSACEVQYCLDHRHQRDHKCPKYEEPKERLVKTKELTEKIVSKAAAESAPKRVPRNAKAQKMAAKVQLMKLKMKSEGRQSVPQTERFYFKVLPPKSLKKSPVGTFVSDTWVMGKVVDSVAQFAKVENKNNVAGAKKLKLFRYQDGSDLCVEMQKELRELAKGEEIFNGDCVILEYVDPDQNSVIPSEYAQK